MAAKSQDTVVLFCVIANAVRQEVYDIEIKHNAVITLKGVNAMHRYQPLGFGYMNDPQKQ